MTLGDLYTAAARLQAGYTDIAEFRASLAYFAEHAKDTQIDCLAIELNVQLLDEVARYLKEMNG